MSTLRPSYGFSALFEAMDVAVRREESENTISDFAAGLMEISVVGDPDIIEQLNVSQDIPTGADDYDNVSEDDINEPGMKALNDVLDSEVEKEDNAIEKSLEESMELFDSVLESIIEEDIYGGY